MSVNEKYLYVVHDTKGNLVGVFSTGNKIWQAAKEKYGETPFPRLRSFVETLRGSRAATFRIPGHDETWRTTEVRCNECLASTVILTPKTTRNR